MTSDAGPVTVLVAEDEAIIRLDLRETLEEAGYEVIADVGRGDEAVALVEQLTPDVAILDVKMPGLDGLEAASRIAADRRTAVVILTAFSQRELVEEATRAGAMAYLVKPFQRADVIPAIEIALARHRDLRGMSAEVDELNTRLEARKAIDRAKGRLMDEHGLSESEAFRFLRSTAMDDRSTMHEIARRVLDGTVAPGSASR